MGFDTAKINRVSYRLLKNGLDHLSSCKQLFLFSPLFDKNRKRGHWVNLFALIIAALVFSVTAQAQVTLRFNDTTPTLEAGIALTAGARYRFDNVAPGTDALVTVVSINGGASLTLIDDNASFADRFQPQILTTIANSTGWVRFDFQLVASGTNTPRAVPLVYLSAQDTDGGPSIREFVEFLNTGPVTVASPTLLVSAASLAGGTRYIVNSEASAQNGIGTDNRYETYTTINNSSTFTIIGGNVTSTACTGAGTACSRQNSYSFDPASSNQPVPNPDVSITKTGPAAVNIGGNVSYTLTATNNGATTAHGSTITDNVPASLTGVTISCTPSGGAVCPVTTGLTTLSNVFIPTFPVGGQVVFTVSGTASVGGSISNVATIAPPNGATDPNTANNTSATVNTTVRVPDLTIAKSHTGNFTTGSTGTYSLTVTNSGAAPTLGAITVSDTLPAGLTVNGGAVGAVTLSGANAANWTCNSNAATPQVITCTSSTAISNTAGSNTSVFNFNVNVGLGTAVGTNSITNTANVSGGSESNTANNSASDPTTVVSPDLTIAKTHTGDFTRGSTGTYTLTVSNGGTASTSGTITVTDTLPAGLSVAVGPITVGGTNAANWTCNATTTTSIACTSTTAISNVAGSNTSVFNFSVNVASGAAATVTNNVNVSGGGEATANSGNNAATDPTNTIATADMTIAKSHTGNFTVGSTGTYTLTVNNIGGQSSSGTITVSDTLPAGLTVNGGAAGAVTLGGANAANWTCNSNAATPQVVTCTSTTAIAVAGNSVFNFNVNVGLGTAVGTNSITNTADVSGGGETNTANNSASDPTTVVSPNLTLAKSHTGSFTVGSTGAYTLTATNSGTAPTSGTITISDTLPAGLTVNGGAAGAVTLSGANAANWTCNSNAATPQVITCTSTTAISNVAGSNTSVFNFNVNVGLGTAVGTNSITNNAAISGGGEATANNGDNAASDPTTVLSPNLSLAKTHVGNFTRGSTGTYTLTVTNGGTASTSGTITVTDTLPVGLSVAVGPITPGGTNAANWTCNATTTTSITCTSTTAISNVAGSNTSVFTFAVNVSSTAAATVTNNASVSGGNEATANNGNNSASDPTTTVAAPDMTITKSHTGSFTAGTAGTYSFTVRNIGGLASSGTITVSDTLPAGLTVNGGAAGGITEGGANAANWTCNSNAATPQVITCTSTTAIAAAGTSVFNFPVNVGLGTAVGTNSITNIANVSGGGETNTANNSASDPTTVLSPNLAIAKSHTGNFTVGSTGAYTFTVTNGGTTSTNGTITVSDTLPSGLTVNGGGVGAVTLSGANAANWTCNSNAATPQVITCTSTTVISNVAGSNTSVFSFNINVGLGTVVGTNSITNNVTVSGGREATANNTNNSASDPTTVQSPDLTLAKTHSGNFTRGSTGTYSLTVTNAGTASTNGTITVTDTLPAGLTVNGGAAGAVTLGGTNAANWACNSNAASPQVITCTSTTAIAISGISVFNFTVNVLASAADSVTNNASVSGGGEATANNGNNSASDPTAINASAPNITLVKSCTSPANCTTASQLPGTELTYQIRFTNTGGQPASNMAIVDGIPADTDFKLGTAAVNVGSTGLTFVIEYSNDYDPLNPTLATWGYSPVSAGGGAPAGYDRNVKAIRWRVTAGNLSNISPNDTGNVSFITMIR